MFCPNCGKSEQQTNAYCRNCGAFTPDLSGKNKISFGGSTPDEQIRVNLFLNLLSAIFSVILALTLYITFFGRADTSPVIYIVAAFMLAMSGWQFSTFAVGLKLKKKFARRKESKVFEKTAPNQPDLTAAETRELLSEPDLRDVVPASVVENTTKNLSAKVPRRSPQAEQQSDR